MQPSVWRPPVELSPAEQQIVKRMKRAKLFIFLREHRHTLFDETFQQELATMLRTRRKASRRFLQRNWGWQPSCKRTPGCPMTN
jgi:lipopolysaccharide biosynthesis protein